MDIVSSHSSGTGPVMHYELPTADALEAKLVVERDSASVLRDGVDMGGSKQHNHKQYSRQPLNIWWISKRSKLRLTRLLRS